MALVRALVAQLFDFLRQPVAVIGDNPLDIGKPVFHRTNFGPQLGILIGQQLDTLDVLG